MYCTSIVHIIHQSHLTFKAEISYPSTFPVLVNYFISKNRQIFRLYFPLNIGIHFQFHTRSCGIFSLKNNCKKFVNFFLSLYALRFHHFFYTLFTKYYIFFTFKQSATDSFSVYEDIKAVRPAEDF